MISSLKFLVLGTEREKKMDTQVSRKDRLSKADFVGGMLVAHFEHPGRRGVVMPDETGAGGENLVFVQFEPRKAGAGEPGVTRIRIGQLAPLVNMATCQGCLFVTSQFGCCRYHPEGKRLAETQGHGKKVPEQEYPDCQSR